MHRYLGALYHGVCVYECDCHMWPGPNTWQIPMIDRNYFENETSGYRKYGMAAPFMPNGFPRKIFTRIGENPTIINYIN